MFHKPVNLIYELSKIEFKHATADIRTFIDQTPIIDFKEIVKQIGTTPESSSDSLH